MVNTDYFQSDHDDTDRDAPYRTFGLGFAAGTAAAVSIRREHR
jgi:hypothetical protein